MKVITGRRKQPVKIMIYGPAGAGKSTAAADWDDEPPLFFSGQSGDSELSVGRYCFDEKTGRCYARDWSEVLKGALDVAAQSRIKTVVFDELGAMEQKCAEYLCEKHKWPSVAHLGYGKGEGALHAEMRVLLKIIEDIWAKGSNILFTLHAKQGKVPNPKGEDFKRFEPALTSVGQSGFICETFMGWCSSVLFLTPEMETTKVGEDTKRKTIGAGSGVRKLYTQERAWLAAKCHYRNVDSEFEVPLNQPLAEFKAQIAEGQNVEAMSAKVRRLATAATGDLARQTAEWLATPAAKDLGALLDMSAYLSAQTAAPAPTKAA